MLLISFVCCFRIGLVCYLYFYVYYVYFDCLGHAAMPNQLSTGISGVRKIFQWGGFNDVTL